MNPLNKIYKAICNNELGFDLVNAVLCLAGIQKLSRLSVDDKKADVVLKKHQQKIHIQIKIAEGPLSYLLIPFEPLKALETLRLFCLKRCEYAALLADIYHTISYSSEPPSLKESALSTNRTCLEKKNREAADAILLSGHQEDSLAYYIENSMLLSLQECAGDPLNLLKHFSRAAVSVFSKKNKSSLLKQFVLSLSATKYNALCNQVEDLEEENSEKWIYNWVKILLGSKDSNLCRAAIEVYQDFHSLFKDEKRKKAFFMYILSRLFPVGTVEAHHLIAWAQKHALFSDWEEEREALIKTLQKSNYKNFSSCISYMVNILKNFLYKIDFKIAMKDSSFECCLNTFIQSLEEEQFIREAREIVEMWVELKQAHSPSSQEFPQLIWVLNNYLLEKKYDKALKLWCEVELDQESKIQKDAIKNFLSTLIKEEQMTLAASILLNKKFHPLLSRTAIVNSLQKYFEFQCKQEKEDLYYEKMLLFTIENKKILKQAALSFAESVLARDRNSAIKLLKKIQLSKKLSLLFSILLDQKHYKEMALFLDIFAQFESKNYFSELCKELCSSSNISLESLHSLCLAVIEKGFSHPAKDLASVLIKEYTKADHSCLCLPLIKLIAETDLRAAMFILTAFRENETVFIPSLELLVDASMQMVDEKEVFKYWEMKIEWLTTLTKTEILFTKKRMPFFLKLISTLLAEQNGENSKLFVLYELLKNSNYFYEETFVKERLSLQESLCNLYMQRKKWMHVVDIISKEFLLTSQELARKYFCLALDEIIQCKKTVSVEILELLQGIDEKCKKENEEHLPITQKLSELWLNYLLKHAHTKFKEGNTNDFYNTINFLISKIERVWKSQRAFDSIKLEITKNFIGILENLDTKEKLEYKDFTKYLNLFFVYWNLNKVAVNRMAPHPLDYLDVNRPPLDYIDFNSLFIEAVFFDQKQKKQRSIRNVVQCISIHLFEMAPLAKTENDFKKLVRCLEKLVFFQEVEENNRFAIHNKQAGALLEWAEKEKIFTHFPEIHFKIVLYLKSETLKILPIKQEKAVSIFFELMDFVLKGKNSYALRYLIKILNDTQILLFGDRFDDIKNCYSRLIKELLAYPDCRFKWKSFSFKCGKYCLGDNLFEVFNNLFFRKKLISEGVTNSQETPFASKNYMQIVRFIHDELTKINLGLREGSFPPSSPTTLRIDIEKHPTDTHPLTILGHRLYALHQVLRFILLNECLFWPMTYVSAIEYAIDTAIHICKNGFKEEVEKLLFISLIDLFENALRHVNNNSCLKDYGRRGEITTKEGEKSFPTVVKMCKNINEFNHGIAEYNESLVMLNMTCYTLSSFFEIVQFAVNRKILKLKDYENYFKVLFGENDNDDDLKSIIETKLIPLGKKYRKNRVKF